VADETLRDHVRAKHLSEKFAMSPICGPKEGLNLMTESPKAHIASNQIKLLSERMTTQKAHAFDTCELLNIYLTDQQ
jgi:hypothetical protein